MDSSEQRQQTDKGQANAPRRIAFAAIGSRFLPAVWRRERSAPSSSLSNMTLFQAGFRSGILLLALVLTALSLWQEHFSFIGLGSALTVVVLLTVLQRAPVAWTRERPLTFTAPVVFPIMLWMGAGVAALGALTSLFLHARFGSTAGRSRGYIRFQGAQLAVAAIVGSLLLRLAARQFGTPFDSRLVNTPNETMGLLATTTISACGFALTNALLTAIANLGELRRLWRAPDTRARSGAVMLVYLLGILPAVLLSPMGATLGLKIVFPLMLLLLLCAQVARLNLEVVSLRRQLETANKMGHASVARSDADNDSRTLLQQFLTLANGLVAADRALVWTMNAETGHLTLAASLPDPGDFGGRRVVYGEGLLGHAAARLSPRLIADASRDRHRGEREAAAGAWLLYPIVVQERLLGVAQWIRPVNSPFTKEDVTRLHSLVPMAAVALDNVCVREEMHNLAATDGLTGLWNHRRMHELLREEMRRSTRYHRALSVLMLDVDSFKTFNDTYGHPQGDNLLRSIATILRDNVRNVDHVGRYGGEEFLVVLPETSKDDACRLAERIRSAVETKAMIVVGGQEIRRTVSVGVAAYPEDALNPGELVQRADEALYRAKRGGKNRVIWA